VSRQARARLAPITGPGPVDEVTVVTHDHANEVGRHRGDEQLWRLARTDLLELQVPSS